MKPKLKIETVGGRQVSHRGRLFYYGSILCLDSARPPRGLHEDFWDGGVSSPPVRRLKSGLLCC